MSDVHARRLLIGLVLAAVALTIVIVQPFWQALFLAAVLAAALRPIMEWLVRALRGRRTLAAAIVTIALLLVVVIPLAGLAAILVGQIADGIQWLRETIQSEGVWGLVERLPPRSSAPPASSCSSCPSRRSSCRPSQARAVRRRRPSAGSSRRPGRSCSRR